MKVALAQMMMGLSMEENYTHSVILIEKASKQGADLICFPELQLTSFFPQYEKRNVDEYAIKLDSKYVRGIMNSCKKNQIFAVPNFYVEENEKRYDMSLLIDDEGNILGNQKMVHIAQAEQFYEQVYYTPSEEGFQVFDTRFGTIGIVICFDRHYPESIRTSALKGADLILIPTANTTAEPMDMFAWEIKVQAFQNSVNIAMCNRTGWEDKMKFSGQSIMCDYHGNTIALADEKEQLLIAEVELSQTKQNRGKKPYTNLRRPELYY